MSYPHCCLDCEFEGCCNTAMYMDGCRFFPPMNMPLALKERVRNFFSKFFG